jgi:hypothetical protein
MSTTIILDVNRTVEVTGHNEEGMPVGNTHFHVHPYIEGVELEENVMGEDRPTYHRTCEGFAIPATDATLYAVLEDAYKNERDYVEGIGETLMKVEVSFSADATSVKAYEADGEDFTMYSMRGAGTDCTITEEYKALKG